MIVPELTEPGGPCAKYDRREQRTDEWRASRVGKITASQMKRVLAVSKRDGKPLQARQDYLAEIVCERLTGKAQGIPMSPAMQWGVDMEPTARAAYESRTGLVAMPAGFLLHANGYCGASPDGLVANDGGVEIKCPWNSLVHIETLLHGMPEDHMPQVQCAMWVTGRVWWDFVSFDPRMPEKLRLYVQRIERDQDYIADMSAKCAALWAEADALLEQLQKLAR